jgi:hypothetical protein
MKTGEADGHAFRPSQADHLLGMTENCEFGSVHRFLNLYCEECD